MDFTWEGREWVNARKFPINNHQLPTIRIVSTRVYSDFKTAFMHHSVHKVWENRSKLLLAELINYDADIICLQDVDHFQEFWYPKLITIGYDCVYRCRTQEKDFHYDGILIALKRGRFQVYKSEFVDFNNALTDDSKGSVFKERCKTDDVALVTFIQTLNVNDLPTSVCLVCAMFNELISNQDIRIQHSIYLTDQVQKMNRDFQIPVVICTNLNDSPSSGPYSLFRTGRLPLVPQVPPRPMNVRAKSTSRATAMISWLPPKLSIADPNINSYRICWRPGGSTTLGFRSQVDVAAGDCIKYIEKLDENNRRKVVALEELQYHVLGLVSDLPYEFRVCAVNDVGEGVWSLPCVPIVLHNPEKAPSLPPLTTFESLNEVLEKREMNRMQFDDINVHMLLKVDPINPPTSLTPRLTDGSINRSIGQGRVLPHHENLRLGWKPSLDGQIDAKLSAELNREYILSKSLLRDREGFKEKTLNVYNDLDIKSDFLKQNEFVKLSAVQNGADGSSFILDGREALNHLGEPNRRHIHSLQLRSAYESYSCCGEPAFNAFHPKERETQGVNCADYIFYSTTGLFSHRLLSLPTTSMMRRGETPEETLTTSDICHLEQFPSLAGNFDRLLLKLSDRLQSNDIRNPSSVGMIQKRNAGDINQMKRSLKDILYKSHGSKTLDSTSKQVNDCEFWGGRWQAFPIPNKLKSNYFLPNASFPSTHLTIGVELVIDENQLSSCLK